MCIAAPWLIPVAVMYCHPLKASELHRCSTMPTWYGKVLPTSRMHTQHRVMLCTYVPWKPDCGPHTPSMTQLPLEKVIKIPALGYLTMEEHYLVWWRYGQPFLRVVLEPTEHTSTQHQDQNTWNSNNSQLIEPVQAANFERKSTMKENPGKSLSCNSWSDIL